MKKFINRIVNVKELILRIWIVLWLMLLILLIMKLGFNEWYPIVCKNELFNNICSWLDNNKAARYSVNFVFYLVNANIIYFISSLRKRYVKWYEALIVNLVIITAFIVKIFNNYLALPVELIYTIIIPVFVLFQNKDIKNNLFRFLYPIIVQVLLVVFQFNILLVRGLPSSLYELPMLVQIIMQLDYYMFIIISWIGVIYMGLMGPWLWSKDVTVLKAEREKELSKKKPNLKKIAQLDNKIAELEEK